MSTFCCRLSAFIRRCINRRSVYRRMLAYLVLALSLRMIVHSVMMTISRGRITLCCSSLLSKARYLLCIRYFTLLLFVKYRKSSRHGLMVNFCFQNSSLPPSSAEPPRPSPVCSSKRLNTYAMNHAYENTSINKLANKLIIK